MDFCAKFYLEFERVLEVLVLGLDGDLGAIDRHDLALKVHQLALHDLDVVAGGEVVREVVFVGGG